MKKMKISEKACYNIISEMARILEKGDYSMGIDDDLHHIDMQGGMTRKMFALISFINCNCDMNDFERFFLDDMMTKEDLRSIEYIKKVIS